MKLLDWLNRAKQFLSSVIMNFESNNLDVAAFDAHQAIELALLATHIHRFGSRPYTHNLVELGKAVGFIDDNLELITFMYTYSRYPEVPIKISKDRVEVFIDVAKRAVEFAEQELEREP